MREGWLGGMQKRSQERRLPVQTDHCNVGGGSGAAQLVANNVERVMECGDLNEQVCAAIVLLFDHFTATPGWIFALPFSG